MRQNRSPQTGISFRAVCRQVSIALYSACNVENLVFRYFHYPLLEIQALVFFLGELLISSDLEPRKNIEDCLPSLTFEGTLE